MKKKFINFQFSDPSGKFDTTKFRIIDSSNSLSDNIEYDITIKDNKYYLESALIEFKNNAGESLKFRSDESGNLKCKIPKSFAPTIIRAVYVGYEINTYNIESDKNLILEFIMSNKFKLIKSGKSITYSIRDIDLNGFYLLGGIFSEWTFFKRVDN